jgi:hypothetical protein
MAVQYDVDRKLLQVASYDVHRHGQVSDEMLSRCTAREYASSAYA